MFTSPPTSTSSRTAHRLRLFTDRDALHAGAVAAAACVFSAGLVYVGYFLHVLRVARTAPSEPERGESLLLFGKHAPQGRIDADFASRLERAAALWPRRPPRRVVLLGGGDPGTPSEAEVARHGLLALVATGDVPLLLEAQSRDTLQNLRNARVLLRDASQHGRVTLLSNRYHLARCALFARQLGFDWELCAAEPTWRWHPRTLLLVAGEAAFVCWSDVGTRWARLIGHRRMLSKVT
jgi:uncharacterized SAM-binding protein YcdF (DUF218 family)